MVDEYQIISESLKQYNLPNVDFLIDKVWEKVKDKSIEDIIWEHEGGNAKPISVYYDGENWRDISEYNGNEIVGVQLIRKAKDSVDDTRSDSEKAKEYWRMREVKFIRDRSELVPVGDWFYFPNETTKKIREAVGKVYSRLSQNYDFDLTLFGSAANGTMRDGSDLEYTIIFDDDKIMKSKEFKELYQEALDKLKNERHAEWEALRKIHNKVVRQFESEVVNEAKQYGLDLKIGRSYTLSKDKDSLYDPYGTSTKKPMRVLYSKDGLKIINYKEYYNVRRY